MRIRQAEPSEAEVLWQLAQQTYVAAFGHSMSAADLAAHLAQHLSLRHIEAMLADDTLLVAEANGRLVGFVQLGKGQFEGPCPDAWELRRLYVLAKFQNKGIGNMLMKAALTHPNLTSADCIYLDVWEHNHGAQRLYARHGFEVVDKRRFVLESGEEGDFDLIMVRRRLT
ncbi:MAG: GNAT family N-acetyltransferase [Anaerolineae bacterium]|nr:GNAT family N-acetyltransferase [Anaerolineae bacterium]